MDRLIEILESFRRTEHYECEDPFYSCPSHSDFIGTNYEKDYCNCGLVEDNARVDEALKIIKEMST